MQQEAKQLFEQSEAGLREVPSWAPVAEKAPWWELAEEAAGELRNLATGIVQASPSVVYVKDADGRIVVANAAAAELFQTPLVELTGKTEAELTSACGFGSLEEAAQFTTADVERYTPELRLETQSGAARWFHAIHRALPGREPGETRILCIATEITRGKQIEEALTQAKEAAEVASLAKSQLIASMSHELRTPLNAILGFSEMLAEEEAGNLTDRQKRWVANIEAGGKQLRRLIDDVLELAKLDAHRLDLAFERFSPVAAISVAVESRQAMAAKKSVTLRTEISPPLPELFADPDRFQQALGALLDNAVKFSPEGSEILVTAGASDRGGAEPNLLLCVADQGGAIPADDLKKLFFETEPLGPEQRHKYTGIRIGLALMRRLIEAQNGKIWAENRTDGPGVRFCIEMPAQRAGNVVGDLQAYEI